MIYIAFFAVYGLGYVAGRLGHNDRDYNRAKRAQKTDLQRSLLNRRG